MAQAPLPLTSLGDIPIDTFLREYWQQKPLLVRNALPGFQSPLEADELAGLALEQDVVSRLVIETPTANPLISDWQVEHGPFDENRFTTLPESHWSLLVQHVDQLEPEVNRLLDYFRFLPGWRLDDIMISYAPDGGGVGPHFDYYDVFLLQGAGQRRWRTGQVCDSQSPLLPDQPMKVLTGFDTQNDWTLNPGDLLYLPPGLAHWGTAIGESVTYSVGFRAPSYSDFLLDYSQQTADTLSPDERYRDRFNHAPTDSGCIDNAAIEAFGEIIRQQLDRPEAIAKWLLSNMTEPNPGELAIDEDIVLPDGLPKQTVVLSRFARASWYPLPGGSALCGVNGSVYSCSPECARALANHHPLVFDDLEQADQAVIRQLAGQERVVYCQI